MSSKKWMILLLVCFFSFVSATEKDYVLLRCRHDAGLFSIFNDVGTLIKLYEKGLYSGIEVDFAKKGQYYSPEHGDNWWSYYCEPICFGDKINMREITGEPRETRGWELDYRMDRHEVQTLIEKYIKFKPEITEKVDRFQNDHFVGKYVIGVHYRGTDKTEAPRVNYETVAAKVEQIARRYGGSSYKIFIATDEQEFLDYMIRRYGDLVIYNTEAFRSVDGTALHFGNYDRYKCGQDAIVDSLLLSRSQYLVRVSSNLSLWFTFFNPDLPNFLLNHDIWDPFR